MVSPSRSTVAFLAKDWSPSIVRRFERLHSQTQPDYPCAILVDDSRPNVFRQWVAFAKQEGREDLIYRYCSRELSQRFGSASEPTGRATLSGCHLPLLAFAAEHAFDHYWAVGSDVEFRGDWSSLFGRFEADSRDLLASHLHRYAQWPGWYWWNRGFAGSDGLPPPEADRLKALLPIYRLSGRALREIETAHRAGWRGHCECVVPTVLGLRGLGIGDLNEAGRVYVGDWPNPISNPARLSSLRWQPEASVEEFERREAPSSLLFHPIPNHWYFDGQRVVVASPAQSDAADPMESPPDTKPSPTSPVTAPPCGKLLRRKVGEIELWVRPGGQDLLMARSNLGDEYTKVIDLLRAVRRPVTVLDLGGYIGAAAIAFASRIPHARVVTVEPSPDNFRVLQLNTAPYPNIVALNAAVGSRNGVSEVFARHTGTWGHTLVGHPEDCAKPTIVGTTSVMTVANLLSAAGVDAAEPLALVKIDIEGSEVDLLGSPEWSDRAAIVLAELHDRIVKGCTASWSRVFEQNEAWESIPDDGEKRIAVHRGRLRQILES